MTTDLFKSQHSVGPRALPVRFQIMELLMKGNKQRTQEPTAANQTSSRSHAVLQVAVKQQSRCRDVLQEVRFARLFMIDLAGSERAAQVCVYKYSVRRFLNVWSDVSLGAVQVDGLFAVLNGCFYFSHLLFRKIKVERLHLCEFTYTVSCIKHYTCISSKLQGPALWVCLDSTAVCSLGMLGSVSLQQSRGLWFQ